MLSEADKDAYLGPLESGRVRPALITLDDELLALGPRFLSFVRQNYVSDDGVFYSSGPGSHRFPTVGSASLSANTTPGRSKAVLSSGRS